MNAQPDLFLHTRYPPGFFGWLRENRHVYEAFERLALQMWNSGRRRYSPRAIVEVIRWNTDLADTDKTFKINDHWTSGLSRYFMEQHPRCKGFFELREREHASDVGRIRHPEKERDNG